MKVKFYVLHCDSSVYTCFITSNEDGINSYNLGNKTIKKIDEENIKIMPAFHFHLFLNELECCPQFHQAVARNFKSNRFVIQITPTKYEYIDRTW